MIRTELILNKQISPFLYTSEFASVMPSKLKKHDSYISKLYKEYIFLFFNLKDDTINNITTIVIKSQILGTYFVSQ